MSTAEQATPDPGPTDAELMAKTRAGDQAAFMTLVRRHQEPLLNYFRRLGAYNDAEDLVQDTFLRVFKYRFKYQPVAKFTTFLYTLGRHAWADSLRKTMRREKLQDVLEEEAPGSDERSMGRAPAAMDAQAALDALSDKLRPVVVMSLYQGLRYEEIAEILEIPVGTVKSRMFVALSQLKALFKVP